MAGLSRIVGAALSVAWVLACGPGGGGGEASPCGNGMQDGTETAIDCGGGCGLCPGSPCAAPVECASLVCNGTCVEGNCQDGVRNNYELGVDCGGSCGGCAVGKK